MYKDVVVLKLLYPTNLNILYISNLKELKYI